MLGTMEIALALVAAALLVLPGLAVACALIAHRKGRSTALWAVLGFFFGPIALLIIACLPNESANQV